MFLHATALAYTEFLAVTQGSRPPASAHAPLAPGSVFQETGTIWPESRLLKLDNQRRRDGERKAKQNCDGRHSGYVRNDTVADAGLVRIYTSFSCARYISGWSLTALNRIRLLIFTR